MKLLRGPQGVRLVAAIVLAVFFLGYATGRQARRTEVAELARAAERRAALAAELETALARAEARGRLMQARAELLELAAGGADPGARIATARRLAREAAAQAGPELAAGLAALEPELARLAEEAAGVPAGRTDLRDGARRLAGRLPGEPW